MIILTSANGSVIACNPKLQRHIEKTLHSPGFADLDQPSFRTGDHTRGDDLAVDVALDGRLAIDLLDSIWIVPNGGGQAEQISAIEAPARRPRWSPLDDAIVYQTAINGLEQIQLYRFASGLTANIGDGKYLNQHPSWHPMGDRLLFSSDRYGSGFDIWEYDVTTGLSWRITHLDGDELEPAWSADGRDLVYVHRHNQQWSIMIRRFGMPDRRLLTSNARISAPQWRPNRKRWFRR